MRKIVLLLLPLLFTLLAGAQEAPVQFTFAKDTLGAGQFNLRITARIKPGIKLFSVNKISDELPVNTKFEFDSTARKYLADSIQEKGAAKKEIFAGLDNTNITFYTDSVVWLQKIQLNKGDSVRIKGNLEYYYASGEAVESGAEGISNLFRYIDNYEQTGTVEVKETAGVIKNDLEKKSLIGILLAGLAAGLIGFLTPCVYALVPVTVSMFLKRSKTPAQGKKSALFYAFSIMAIYTMVGVLLATILPANTLNNISTNWLFNLFIFALFIIFGFSFLGAFEISLPASWANKLDKKANMNSYLGVFFMALVLVVVSFSCTGNFVASLIGVAFTIGKPAVILGMFGFGLGLALPFALFAIFPSLLKELSKSGGWQNALKVTLGFLELALALKFLSNVDLDKRWGILDREVFLVLWIVIFILLGMYLLGKLRFKLDSELPRNTWGLEYIPVSRLMLAIASLAFAVYLIPGLWGAPLKAVSAFVPPMGTQDFIITRGGGVGNEAGHTTGFNSGVQPPVKHVKELKRYEPLAAIENSFTVYYDYNEALAAAKALKKPLLLDFTGIQCVNCREFESKIWSDAAVANSMKNDFVIASLFTDFNEELPDEEQVYSQELGNKIKTVGDKYEALQLKLIRAAGQPNYVFLDTNEKLLANEGYGYDARQGPKDFTAHLEKVKAEFKKRNP